MNAFFKLKIMQMKLKKIATLELETKKPFNFKFTVWKPSHFPSRLEVFDNKRGICYRTILLGKKPLGLKLSKLEQTGIRANIYSNTALNKEEKQELIYRLRQSYGLDEILTKFYAITRKDPLIKKSVASMKGMRNSCPHTLFEILCISLVLQNTNVKRSQNMLNFLLENYGQKIEFDNQKMYSFFTPEKIAKVSEQELEKKADSDTGRNI